MAPTPRKFQSSGPQDMHRVRPAYLNRDARPTLQRITDYLSRHENLAFLMAGTAVVAGFFPATLIPCILVLGGLLLWRQGHPETLDVRLPVGSARLDANDPLPGRKAFRKPRGIFPLGNNSVNGKEIWISREDLLTHLLFFGTTGSGKSYSLTGLAANFLGMGGGLIYVDAKSAPSLNRDIYAIACRLGRDDHYLVLNLITGNRTINSRSREKFSNTLNFMVFGSSSSIADTMISLIGASGDDANSVFKDNAISLMTAALMVLVDLRDAKLITLGPNRLREWMTLDHLMAVSNQCRKGFNNGNPAQTNARYVQALRPETMETLNAFLKGLPAFDFGKAPGEQGETTYDQFGYARMYWNRALNMLSDTYRHIFWTDVADVDMRDIIMKRRILVVMLPALEKAPADLMALGKLILSSLKSAVSTNLPASLVGLRKEIDREMPMCPGGILMDEYAYINTPGFAVMPAQARGLGISLTFAGQDFAGFKRADENEARQIISNTTIKVAMRMEDAEDTFGLFKTAAGDAKVSQVAGFSTEGAVLSNYTSTGNISLESVPRLDFNDFREAIEGEAFLFYRSRIITVTMFSHEMKKNREQPFYPAALLPLPFFPAEPYRENRKSVLEALVFLSMAAAVEKMDTIEDESLAQGRYGLNYELRYAGALLEVIRRLPQWTALRPGDFVAGTLASCLEMPDEYDADMLYALAGRLGGVSSGNLAASRPMYLPDEAAESPASIVHDPRSQNAFDQAASMPRSGQPSQSHESGVTEPDGQGAGGATANESDSIDDMFTDPSFHEPEADGVPGDVVDGREEPETADMADADVVGAGGPGIEDDLVVPDEPDETDRPVASPEGQEGADDGLEPESAAGEDERGGREDGRSGDRRGGKDAVMSGNEADRLLTGAADPEVVKELADDYNPDAPEVVERRATLKRIGTAVGLPEAAAEGVEAGISKAVYPESPVEPAERTSAHESDMADHTEAIRRVLRRIRGQ